MCIQGENFEERLKAVRVGGRKVTLLSDAFHLNQMFAAIRTCPKVGGLLRVGFARRLQNNHLSDI